MMISTSKDSGSFPHYSSLYPGIRRTADQEHGDFH